MLIVACLFVVGFAAIGSALLSAQSTGELGNLMAMGRSDDVSSLTGRLPLWEELLHWVNKSPLVGYGYLAFWDSKRVEYLSDTFRWEIPHGHNMYLDITLDVGIVGLILFVSLLIFALYSAAKLYVQTGKVEYAIVAGIFICAMVNGAGESLFKLPGFPLFVLISTFIALLHELDELQKVESNKPLFARRRALGQ
jgi:O-antigen ligase